MIILRSAAGLASWLKRRRRREDDGGIWTEATSEYKGTGTGIASAQVDATGVGARLGRIEAATHAHFQVVHARVSHGRHRHHRPVAQTVDDASDRSVVFASDFSHLQRSCVIDS